MQYGLHKIFRKRVKMTAEKIYSEGAAVGSAYFDNLITYDVISEEAIDEYYDNLISFNLQKKSRLDAKISIRAAKNRIVRIVFIAVIMATLFGMTIFLKAEINERERSIVKLTSQVENLARENTDKKKRLDDSTNILFIKEKAMNLGMNYAGKEAIVYYTVGKDDYMRSYTY